MLGCRLLSHLPCRAKDYFELASRLRIVSQELCAGRLIAVMEGGYTTTGKGRAETVRHCVAAFGQGLAGLSAYDRTIV